MSNLSIEDILKRLPKNQAAVLYWKCQGLKYEEIGFKLNYGVEWVTLQMSHVYAKLNLKDKSVHWTKRRDFLENEVCPIFQKLTEGNPENLNWWPLSKDELAIVLVEKENKPDPVTYPLVLYDEMRLEENAGEIIIPSVVIPATIQTRRRFPVALALVFLVGCLAVGYIAYRFGLSRIASIPLIEITSTSAPTDIPLPTSTFTLVPSDTPLPTNTPLPSETPTPSPVPTQPPTFLDDFADGLDPAWTIVYGKPVISNEQLVAGEETLLSVGDIAWTNYQVEFDVKMGRYTCQDSQSSFLGVRATDIDNMLIFRFHPCETEWSSVVSGIPSIIPGTFLGNQGYANNSVHLVIMVEGNKITVREKSNILNSIIDTDHPSGNVYLRIRPDTVFDNFEVNLLP